MERIYKRNLLYQQISFKIRCFRELACPSSSRTITLRCILTLLPFLDCILGVVLINTIYSKGINDSIGCWVTNYILYMLQWTQGLLEWIMQESDSLRLNKELTMFVGTKCINLLKLWQQFYLSFIALYLHHIIWFILHLQVLGLTIVMATMHDFLKYLNLWLISFYIISSRVLTTQISGALSLLRLFMGYKYNPLRNRVDSCSYKSDQLLLGGLVFTILVFLLPTTFIYYALFFSLQVLHLVIQLFLRVTMVTVNQATLLVANKILSCYQTPHIHTLRLCFRRDAELLGPSIVGHWNGKELSLMEVKELINSYEVEDLVNNSKHKNNNIVIDHSMLKWVDMSFINLFRN